MIELKILRVASSLYPEVNGGVGLHVDQMSRQQASKGHQVTVLTSDNGNHSLPRQEKRGGYSIIRHREIIRPLDNSIIPGILRSIRKLASSYDVIHAHSHLYFSTNVAAVISKVSNTPLAVTNHGLFSQTAPQLVQKIYIPTIARPTLNAADRIFCYTELARAELRERNVSTPVSVIPNGINCDSFKPEPTIETEKQILFVGRLKKGKGPHYLIQAFASIASQYPELTLKIVGDGPMRDQLVLQCEELEIADRVSFAGELSYTEMPTVYNESLMLVSPTLTEAAVPRVVMESWACETPVVMSDIDEVSADHIGDAGILVPLRDAAALSEEMVRLLENESERIEMGERGRQRVLRDHSWAETVNKTTNALQEISEANP